MSKNLEAQMDKFTDPLDKIKIASPCAADWKEMHGDARQRFCAECKLNVYNLSAMTRKEAESFLFGSEDRVCVRFYRRADGTILTQNCPVGWAKVKQRVSKIATAAFSMVAGFFSGFAAFSQFTNLSADLAEQVAVEQAHKSPGDERLLMEVKELTYEEPVLMMGRPEEVEPIKPKLSATRKSPC